MNGKRFLLICGLCLMISPLYACGNGGDTGKSETIESNELSGNTNTIDTEMASNGNIENVIENDSIQQNLTGQAGTEELPDPYVGEYNDYDTGEPNLKIQKKEDGTYLIQIGIFRLVQMDDCVGHEKNGKIEFSVNNWKWADNGKISGIITLEENDAVVKFTAGWNDSVDEYRYYR